MNEKLKIIDCSEHSHNKIMLFVIVNSMQIYVKFLFVLFFWGGGCDIFTQRNNAINGPQSSS